MDRGGWRATVHRVTKSQTRLSTHTHTDKVCSSEFRQDLETKAFFYKQETGTFVPGGPHRVLLGFSPLFPLTLHLEENGYRSRKGIKFWIERVITNSAEELGLRESGSGSEPWDSPGRIREFRNP